MDTDIYVMERIIHSITKPEFSGYIRVHNSFFKVDLIIKASHEKNN